MSPPFHAHVYFDATDREVAETLHRKIDASRGSLGVLYVGEMRDRPLGPHPKPQFEIHFLEASLGKLMPLLEASGLRALVHPLTDDDLADHTTLAT